MPKNISYTKTTNLDTGKVSSFKTESSSSSNLGKVGLSSLGRAGVIGITVITISIGASIGTFTKQTLISFTPNYDVHNDYISVDDPINHYNYIPYGENVVSNLFAWVNPIAEFGQFVDDALTGIIQFWGNDQTVKVGSFIHTYGSDRFYELYQIYTNAPASLGKQAQVFQALTTAEKTFLDTVDTALFVRNELTVFTTSTFYLTYWDVYNLYPGSDVLWFWTMPSVITYIQGL